MDTLQLKKAQDLAWRERSIDIGTWAVQVVLAFLFFIHGWGMLTASDRLRERIPYIFELSPGLRVFTGTAEIAGAAGLLLPGITGILPVLTPLAALGLAFIMLAAIVFHLRRGEAANIGLNVILLILSLWVAYVRGCIAPLG